jgi:hypothetical protein
VTSFAVKGWRVTKPGNSPSGVPPFTWTRTNRTLRKRVAVRTICVTRALRLSARFPTAILSLRSIVATRFLTETPRSMVPLGICVVISVFFSAVVGPARSALIARASDEPLRST